MECNHCNNRGYSLSNISPIILICSNPQCTHTDKYYSRLEDSFKSIVEEYRVNLKRQPKTSKQLIEETANLIEENKRLIEEDIDSENPQKASESIDKTSKSTDSEGLAPKTPHIMPVQNKKYGENELLNDEYVRDMRLKYMGIDHSSPESADRTVAVMGSYMDHMDELEAAEAMEDVIVFPVDRKLISEQSKDKHN